MKEFFKKNFGWLKESNRPLHMQAGFACFALTLLVIMFGMTFAEGNLIIEETLANRLLVVHTLIADWTVFLAMCTCEFVQSRAGGKWDWLDVLAGMVPPIIITLVIMLIFFIL